MDAFPRASRLCPLRSLICVYAAVISQMTTPSERLTTDVTTVRSLICVSAAVNRQITELSECLTTVVTAVRSLICV